MFNSIKRGLLFGSAVLYVTLCSAQSRGYVGITAGPSIPIGDFASKDPQLQSAGWATTGIDLNLQVNYLLGEDIGIAGMFSLQLNNFDHLAYEDELSAQVGGKWTVQETKWVSRGFLLGVYESFPISEAVSFDARGMIGVRETNSPAIETSVMSSLGQTIWIDQSSKDDIAFAYLLGCGIKINLSPRLCLLANASLTGTQPEFKNITITSNAISSPQVFTYTQQMTAINLGFGLGLRL